MLHPPLLWLGVRNLSADRRRFAVTVGALGFCAVLVVFQASLLVGFLRASSRIIRGLEADVFVVPRGVPCIEFSAQLPDVTARLVRGVPGVAEVARGVAGFTNWTTTRGSRQVVLVLGIEPFHSVRARRLIPALGYEQVAVDQSNLAMLELDGSPLEVEINGRRAKFSSVLNGFGTFVGSPYVFAPYADARSWLAIPEEMTSFIAVRTTGAASIEDVVHRLQARFTSVDVYAATSFASTAESFWLTRTGAGGGILMAALLGVFVGAAILSQTLYAITLEHRAEFVTLRALGASNWMIRLVVLVQALMCGTLGWIAGMVLAQPLTRAARGIVPWIEPVWWLPVVSLAATIVLCAVASLAAVRAVLRVDPADVFTTA